MKKLQQFNVMSFTYDRLKNSNFNINLTVFQAEQNDEIIALADNEALRAIRVITNHPFNDLGESKLQDLFSVRKRVTKKQNSNFNRMLITKTNNQINELLFVSEFIFVTTLKKRNYLKIGRDGFFVNGKHYSRFICSAGMARTNRSVFCCDDIFLELNTILRCGCKDIQIAPAKYNAYFSLTASATYRVSKPRVCVISDYEVTRTKLVDWVNENSNKNEQENITRTNKELNFNIFDGMGLISPDFADVWCSDLDLDYKSSAYCIRNAFIKGMVCVFDFKKFADEVSHKYEIIDLWGNKKDIRDIDVVLTQSQFKLWNAYDSWEDYENKLDIFGLSWGIAKFAPNPIEEKNVCRANYQFLQVLNLTDDDIKGLCKPTIDWIKNISGENTDYMSLYLLGKRAKEQDSYKLWNNTQDNFLKALLIYPQLAQDNYIQQRIKMSLSKRIRESFIGKLLINSNFEVLISDPYAFCQHLFGMEVVGLLKDNQVYCKYWKDRNAKTVALFRSPLTWRSEVDILDLQDRKDVNDWYKYIESGIILNTYGVDCMLLGGSDFDFDIGFITDNKYFIKGALNNKIPVAYFPKKASKSFIDNKELYKTDVLGYNTEVGIKTNIGTTFYTIQAKYELDSNEYKELELRLKLCCYQQSMEIDSTKGVVKKPMPNFWTNYSTVLATDSEEEKVRKEFLNKLIANKRPYFMKYLYPTYKNEHENFLKDFNRYSISLFGYPYDEIPEKYKSGEDFIQLQKYYNEKCPLIDSPSTMNKICHYMESQLIGIKKKNKRVDNNELFGYLYNKNIEIDNDKLELLINENKKYELFKQSRQLKNSEFNTYEQFYKNLRNYCLENISNNIQELANLAVYICYKLNSSGKKDFCWDVFGAGIVENLKTKSSFARVPRLNTSGAIEYLGNNYNFEEIMIEEESILNEYSLVGDVDEFSDDIFSELEQIT